MNKIEFTGKIRYRCKRRLFKEPLLVLQIEERHSGFLLDGYGCGLETDFDYVAWRDAKLEDISLISNVFYKELK